MSIRLIDKYPTRATGATGGYPGGSFKNESTPGVKDGTPVDLLWGNDWLGFFAAMILNSGITPSDIPDTALVSDYFNALTIVSSRRKIRSTSSSGAITIYDGTIFVDATGGDITFTTPSAASMIVGGGAVEILVKRIDTSANKVTVQDIEGEDWDLEGAGKPFLRFTSDGTTKWLVG